MSVSDDRHRGVTVRTVVRRVGLVILGIALAGFGVYSTVSEVRIFLEPKARVRLDCEIGHRDHSCPASWMIGHQDVHGTASDPFSGHRYSRFLDHSPNAVLTMHVSGNQAKMTPATSIFFVFLAFPVFGLVVPYGFWDKTHPRHPDHA
jgi:hypothetical protein